MSDNKDLLSSIEKGAQLKHAEIAKDASAPKIEEGKTISTALCSDHITLITFSLMVVCN